MNVNAIRQKIYIYTFIFCCCFHFFVSQGLSSNTCQLTYLRKGALLIQQWENPNRFGEEQVLKQRNKPGMGEWVFHTDKLNRPLSRWWRCRFMLHYRIRSGFRAECPMNVTYIKSVAFQIGGFSTATITGQSSYLQSRNVTWEWKQASGFFQLPIQQRAEGFGSERV